MIRIQLALAIVIALVSPARADKGLFCVFPASKPLQECWKGTSSSEAAVHACNKRNATRKKVPPRVRIDRGAWVELAPDHWRCVRVPVDKSFRFQIENYGRVWYSDRMWMPEDCAAKRVDLMRPRSFYGTMWASCSKRATDRDEIVDPPPASSRVTPGSGDPDPRAP